MSKRILSSAILLAGLWTGFGGTSASALSCMAPDLVRTMEDAKASEKLYHIFVGEVTLISKRELPRTDIPPDWLGPDGDFPKPVRAKMRFDGYSLARSPRADQPLSGFPLDVETRCAAHWCGGLPPQGEMIIAFVEARPEQPPILSLHACPQWVFSTRPGDGQVETLRSLF